MKRTLKKLRTKGLGALLLLTVCFAAADGLAYEVWIGTSCTPSNAAVQTNLWALTAAGVRGNNINLADTTPSPTTPNANDTPCRLAEWRIVLNRYTNNPYQFVPIVRSAYEPFTNLNQFRASVTNRLVIEYNKAANYQYTPDGFMFYDNAINGTTYKWTTTEVQCLREWLDGNGHPTVDLLYDARANTAEVQAWCSSSLVNHIVLEADLSKWVGNNGDRQGLLLWLIPTVSPKKLIFQVPLNNDPYNGLTNGTSYQKMRQLVRFIVRNVLVPAGRSNFIGNPRVIFMPVTYNGLPDYYGPTNSWEATFRFHQEITSDGLRYVNSLTGAALSLIEQKAKFEGLSTTNMSDTVCNSYDRVMP